MFGKKKDQLEALEGMEAELAGQEELAGGVSGVMEEHTGPSPMEEWEADIEEEQEKTKRSLFKKHAPKEKKAKKEKKEKIPLTKEQKKKRRKRIIIGGIVAVILAFTILPKLFAPEVLPVVTVTEVSLGNVEQTIDGSGSVKSEKVRTYFSPVSATVADCDLKVGDTVDAGEILLTYDAAELDELYKEAELTGSAANYGYQDAITKNNENVSEYNRSSAALTTIEQQLDAEEDENEHVQKRITEYSEKQAEAQMNISQYEAIRSDAQAAIDLAQVQLQAAESELAIANGLEDDYVAEDGTTKAELVKAAEDKKATASDTIAAQTKIRDTALQTIKNEQSNLNTINEKLEKYKKRLEDSTERLSDLQTDKAKEEGIKDSSDASILSSAAKSELAANNSLSTLNAQMTKDDINEGKAGITAEFSGVVTEVSAVSGGPAAKGGSLFTVASNESVIVDMSVTRYDLEKLEVGQSAEISLAGNTYTGTVSKLSRLAAANEKGTPVVSAEIHIDDPDDNIYLGLEAKVTVSGRKAEDVIVVPVEAVNTGKEGSFVYTVENGTVVKKPVETGLSSDTLVEITSGLSFGEKVIKSGGESVDEGMKVNALEE